MDKKILIVHYSYSGNTENTANAIREQTGGDIYEIQTVDAYPAGYDDVVKQAKEEIRNGYKPALKNKINNISSYDIIFVGSPNWWSTIAPPVTSFLSEQDLSGKTVIPFCTHGGGGMAKCASDIAKLCPKSTVLEGKAFGCSASSNAKSDIAGWINKILKR